MMSNYIYEPMRTPALAAAIEQRPDLKKFVMEMFYKYGLRVMQYTDRHGAVMTTDGLPYCGIKVGINADGVAEYRYYSQYCKQRGRTDDDKRTVHSTKLSSLIKTLDKCEAINTNWHSVFHPYTVERFKEYAAQTIKGATNVYSSLSASEIYAVLGAYLENRFIEESLRLKCKEELDKSDRARDIKQQRMQLALETVTNPFTLVGVNEILDGYVVCKMKMNPTDGKLPEYPSAEHIEIIEPWRRVPTLEDYEMFSDIAGAVTMLKVHLETNKDVARTCKGLPVHDGAHPTGAISYYESWGNLFGNAWVMFPTEGL